MRWLLLAFFLVITSTSSAQDRAQTSGLGVGVGVGFENAGVGGHALYYFQTRNERWRLAPHVGVGYFGRVAATGGLMALFGRSHRLVLDLMASPAAAYSGIYGGRVDLVYGLSMNAGYEYMGYRGGAFRTTLGIAYRPALRHAADVVFFSWNPISITYKIW